MAFRSAAHARVKPGPSKRSARIRRSRPIDGSGGGSYLAWVSSEKRTVELDLFGHRLSLSTDNDMERVRSLVEMVNRRLETLSERSGRVRKDEIALVASLMFAEELMNEREQHQALRRSVRQRSRRLLGTIDAVARQVDGESPRAGTEVS